MKTKITLDLEIRMGGGETLDTGCVGYMPNGTTYKQLVRVFGKPQHGESPDGKTKMEWTGSINGLAFTIYDYKNPVEPRVNTNWHIGGRDSMVVALLLAFWKLTSTKH